MLQNIGGKVQCTSNLREEILIAGWEAVIGEKGKRGYTVKLREISE